MFGYKRKKRPVELGPYPLETLKRDPSIIKIEATSVAIKPDPMPIGHNTYLVEATKIHLDAYEELRQPQPYSKIAPVPDDLVLRTRDIKGSGYFLDASQIGICKIPNNAWLNETIGMFIFAIVILVEYSNPIDKNNNAADWIEENEHLIATLMAAEIGIDLSGQISSMGFVSKVHWTSATDIDLDKVTVLAGLGTRRKNKITNPFVEDHYAILVVTTNCSLIEDLPLDATPQNAKNLSYKLGLSGAVSGMERWRRKRRPSHLGPYPVETLKRVEKLTTEVFEDEVPRVPSRTNMYVRTAFGDLSQKAKNEADRWSQKHPVSQGIVRPSWAIKALRDGETAQK